MWHYLRSSPCSENFQNVWKLIQKMVPGNQKARNHSCFEKFLFRNERQKLFGGKLQTRKNEPLALGLGKNFSNFITKTFQTRKFEVLTLSLGIQKTSQLYKKIRYTTPIKGLRFVSKCWQKTQGTSLLSWPYQFSVQSSARVQYWSTF